MAVYVDHAQLPYGRMKMSHMLADTHAELVRMADRIGLARRHIQKPGSVYEHFDVCESMRKRAIESGAIAVTSRELVAIRRRRREGAATGADDHVREGR